MPPKPETELTPPPPDALYQYQYQYQCTFLFAFTDLRNRLGTPISAIVYYGMRLVLVPGIVRQFLPSSFLHQEKGPAKPQDPRVFPTKPPPPPATL